MTIESNSAFTKEQIIHQLYTSPEIKRIAAHITKGNDYLKEELLQEVFTRICLLDESHLKKMYNDGYLHKYIIKALKLTFTSDSNQFHRKIKRPLKNMVEIVNDEGEVIFELPSEVTNVSTGDYLDALQKNKNALYWFDKRVYEEYVALGTIKAVAKALSINTAYISASVKKSKAKLKILIKNSIQEGTSDNILDDINTPTIKSTRQCKDVEDWEYENYNDVPPKKKKK